MKHLIIALLLFFPHMSSGCEQDLDDQLLDYLIGDQKESSYWGLHTIIDLEKCDPVYTRNPHYIKKYVVDLCTAIEMKRYGDPIIVYFGKEDRVAGYSLVQLIETSCITGHFADETQTAYIDIFSCKPYDIHVVAYLTTEAFKASLKNITVLERGKKQ